MKITSQNLIADLIERANAVIAQAELFKQQSDESLNWKQNPESWSVLECIEHLNLYGHFYLPEIEMRIKNTTSKPDELFKSGWLGNYFANTMLPKEKLNKMKTFKDKNPINSNLNRKVLDAFVEQQRKMLELLSRASNVSLNKTKTAISITTWIQLKLGDTFRFVIYHNQRHIEQAKKVLLAQ
jgi:DinB superfamily